MIQPRSEDFGALPRSGHLDNLPAADGSPDECDISGRNPESLCQGAQSGTGRSAPISRLCDPYHKSAVMLPTDATPDHVRSHQDLETHVASLAERRLTGIWVNPQH